MSNEDKVFIAVMRLGLWGECMLQDAVSLINHQTVDWEQVLEMSVQQSSHGVLFDGVQLLPEQLRPERSVYMNMLALVMRMEEENKRMNTIATQLISGLHDRGVDCLLLKGQGVARNYRNPMHRQSGDIDLLVEGDEQYAKARSIMQRWPETEWVPQKMHAAYSVGGTTVELHGKYWLTICRSTTRNLRRWDNRRIKDNPRREDGLVMPSLQYDAVFVFAHMLGHFMTGGIGFRQVVDWMLLVSSHFEEIKLNELSSDLNELGLMHFWQVFASMAVKYLGCPSERMPFYNARYDKKAPLVLNAILKTGNFGVKQKEEQLSSEANRWVKKVHTAVGQMPVYWRAGRVFPVDSLYCFTKYCIGVAKGVY